MIDAEGRGASAGPVTPPFGFDVPNMVLELRNGGLIEGQVLDYETGAPVVGATLYCSVPSQVTRHEMGPEVPDDFVAISQDGGTFELAGLKWGDHANVNANNYYRTETTLTPALFGGKRVHQDIRMLRAPTPGTAPECPLPLFLSYKFNSLLIEPIPGKALAAAGFPARRRAAGRGRRRLADYGRDVLEALLQRSCGRPVTIHYLDQGEEKSITVTLSKPPPPALEAAP